jgi:hypothetical protein
LSPATGRARKRRSSARAGAGSARPFLFVLIAILACVAYGGYSLFAFYRTLDSGRQELLTAQARLSSTGQGSPQSPEQALAGLRRSERDFNDARQRAREDPAFRALAAIPAGARQVDASASLAAVGADLSRAGESAGLIAVELDVLRRQYAGRSLTPAELPAALQEAQSTATRYAASAKTVAEQLKAAHSERAAVHTDGLLPPLSDAYLELDGLLAEADRALLRYQDVPALLSEMLGAALP